MGSRVFRRLSWVVPDFFFRIVQRYSCESNVPERSWQGYDTQVTTACVERPDEITSKWRYLRFTHNFTTVAAVSQNRRPQGHSSSPTLGDRCKIRVACHEGVLQILPCTSRALGWSPAIHTLHIRLTCPHHTYVLWNIVSTVETVAHWYLYCSLTHKLKFST